MRSATPLPPPKQQQQPKSGLLGGFWKKFTVGAVLGGVLLEVTTKGISPWVESALHHSYDWALCGGRSAMTEGDRLSDQAAKEPARAQATLQTANTHYAKAYACGFPDAGLRLAVAHCMGLGAPKEPLKARQIVLTIEAKHPEKIGRAGDVRKACNL